MKKKIFLGLSMAVALSLQLVEDKRRQRVEKRGVMRLKQREQKLLRIPY
jgi:hypothetical protein